MLLTPSGQSSFSVDIEAMDDESWGDLCKSCDKLDVSVSDEERLPPNKKLQEAIYDAGFSIFEVKSDLGYFGWNAEGFYKSLSSVTAEDLKHNIQLDRKPDHVANEEELNKPTALPRLEIHKYQNKYPHTQYWLASLHVALKHRHLPLKEIDFFFGDATLHMLACATCSPDDMYLVTMVPGTEILLVVNHKEYTNNYSHPLYQFERLVTGKQCNDRHNVNPLEHLQWMNVGEYGVMFSLKVSDAIDENGTHVEVRMSDPRVAASGTEIMLHMMSSGSLHLVSGIERHGSQSYIFDSVTKERLLTVAEKAVGVESLVPLENKILSGMRALKEEAQAGRFRDGKIFTITFVGSTLVLIPYIGRKDILLPPDQVVEEMLG